MVTVVLPLDLEVTLPLRELPLTMQTKVSSPSHFLSSTIGKVKLCVFLVRVNLTEMELVSKSSPSVAETPEHPTRTVNCLSTCNTDLGRYLGVQRIEQLFNRAVQFYIINNYWLFIKSGLLYDRIDCLFNPLVEQLHGQSVHT